MADIPITDRLLLKGESLAQRTRMTGKLVVVRSGAFKSEARLRSGVRRVLGLHEAGDLMSAEPTLGGVHDAEWLALQSSAVCVVDAWRLQTMAENHAAMGAFLMRNTAAALVRAQQTLFALGSLHAPGRLAWLLLDLSERRRRRGLDPVALSLALTWKDVANHLALRPEAVSRGLGAMARDGVISRKGQDLQILNLERLADLVSGRNIGVPARRTASVNQATPKR